MADAIARPGRPDAETTNALEAAPTKTCNDPATALTVPARLGRGCNAACGALGAINPKPNVPATISSSRPGAHIQPQSKTINSSTLDASASDTPNPRSTPIPTPRELSRPLARAPAMIAHEVAAKIKLYAPRDQPSAPIKNNDEPLT